MSTIKLLWRCLKLWGRIATRGAWWEVRQYWTYQRMLEEARRR